MYQRVKPKCNWGKVQDVYVPAVTFCHLKLVNDYNDFRLGKYENGFWLDGTTGTSSLPFLKQSYDGRYKSPFLDGR